MCLLGDPLLWVCGFSKLPVIGTAECGGSGVEDSGGGDAVACRVVWGTMGSEGFLTCPVYEGGG